MARLGVWSGHGPQLDLHQPTFDLDERALAIGVRLMVNIVEQSAHASRQPASRVPGPMLRAGRVRRSCTYSPGAPAISAASAMTPR